LDAADVEEDAAVAVVAEEAVEVTEMAAEKEDGLQSPSLDV